jgi:uncharacterized 2Fe-2S/4Fe-4S cluster protein (DUF4445 family)
MEICKVTVMPENITVSVQKGTSLLAAAKKAGVDIVSPCGRQGTCGKCAVRVISGACKIEEDAHFPADLKNAGCIPACQAEVEADLVIEVPPASRLTRHKVVLSSQKTRFSREHDYFTNNRMDPISRKCFIKLEKPTLSESMNDLDRLKASLCKAYGYENLQINLECLQKLPETLRTGEWQLTATVADMNGVEEIIGLEPGKSEKPAMGLAVDLGTTTVVVSVLKLENGKVIDKAGSYNEQSAYGSDVISRIVYADETPDGLNLMQRAVIHTVNELIEGLIIKNGLKQNEFSSMVVGGNTVMTHLFFGVTATYLRLEPYVPGVIQFPAVKARQLGIAISPEAPVVSIPSVASYVGGDITAGVLATMLTHSEELTLFIDIGTNGELVLGNNEWMVTCSCSAGPAFEGSGISCGMRAMDGAIDQIEIDDESFEVLCRTIGDCKPLGICGSGLIYSLSEMMEAGIIDRAGQINESINSRRIRRSSEELEYVLVFAEDSGSGKDITVTGSDIKNLLRAKGAIFAGIRTMLREVQLTVADIDRVYIAGGFGNYINITDAINIGLLPDLPADKYEYVGNSCLQGAMLVLLSREAYREAVEISGRMTYLELSAGNLFMEEFVSAMFIPHTDLSLFPTQGKGIHR